MKRSCWKKSCSTRSHLAKFGNKFVVLKVKCRQKKEMIVNNEHYWIFTRAHTHTHTETQIQFYQNILLRWSATNSTRKAHRPVFKWDSFEMTNSISIIGVRNAIFLRKNRLECHFQGKLWHTKQFLTIIFFDWKIFQFFLVDMFTPADDDDDNQPKSQMLVLFRFLF